MQALAQPMSLSPGPYTPEAFRYTNISSLYEQIVKIAKQAGVYIRQYTATRINFENGLFGRRISGIETIVSREFMPLAEQTSSITRQ